MIDVRAPVEFVNGALPSSINLPLISDDERHQVGLRYKNNGQQSAIELGHQLVHGEIKQQRLQAWQDFMQANPNARAVLRPRWSALAANSAVAG